MAWIMASSQMRNVDDGYGNKLVITVDSVRVSRRRELWRWTADTSDSNTDNPFRDGVAGGNGYPDPLSARAAAEHWLTVHRESAAGLGDTEEEPTP